MMTNDNKNNDDIMSSHNNNNSHEEIIDNKSDRPSDDKPSVTITTQEDVNDANKEDEQQEDVPTPKGMMTYADIQNLAYRALQKKCKSVGVSAAGSTVVLRGRLCAHFGLSEVSIELCSLLL